MFNIIRRSPASKTRSEQRKVKMNNERKDSKSKWHCWLLGSSCASKHHNPSVLSYMSQEMCPLLQLDVTGFLSLAIEIPNEHMPQQEGASQEQRSFLSSLPFYSQGLTQSSEQINSWDTFNKDKEMPLLLKNMHAYHWFILLYYSKHGKMHSEKKNILAKNVHGSIFQ